MLQEGVRGGSQDDQRRQQMLNETPPVEQSNQLNQSDQTVLCPVISLPVVLIVMTNL